MSLPTVDVCFNTSDNDIEKIGWTYIILSDILNVLDLMPSLIAALAILHQDGYLIPPKALHLLQKEMAVRDGLQARLLSSMIMQPLQPHQQRKLLHSISEILC